MIHFDRMMIHMFVRQQLFVLPNFMT